ncbi:hypothetical protein [Cellulomonas endophytica]|uniref:hypothetical protein n=1 Tax=Cellulomonas endophytica TaxID=2494735 RepID=UPI00196AA993|nr:hypothetical protein [Cellulomonas endophytica]
MTGPLPPLRRLLLVLLLGAGVGVLGTVVHRDRWPWALVAALVLVLAAGVLARAWVGGAGPLVLGGGMLACTIALVQTGPGGDVLVPAGDDHGILWLLGSVAALVPVAFLPRRWFARPEAGAEAGAAPGAGDRGVADARVGPGGAVRVDGPVER